MAFFKIAALSELDTQMELARELGYVELHLWEGLNASMERVDKMLTGLIRHQKTVTL